MQRRNIGNKKNYQWKCLLSNVDNIYLYKIYIKIIYQYLIIGKQSLYYKFFSYNVSTKIYLLTRNILLFL